MSVRAGMRAPRAGSRAPTFVLCNFFRPLTRFSSRLTKIIPEFLKLRYVYDVSLNTSSSYAYSSSAGTGPCAR